MDTTVIATAIDLIGRVLLHSLWQGALIGLLYGVTMLGLARSAPRARYAAAVTWLAIFALCPFVTLVLMPGQVAAVGPIGAFSGGWWPGGYHEPNALGSVAGVAPYLVSLWLAGVVLLTVRLVWNWRAVTRLTRLDCQPMGRPWDRRLAMLARQIGVHRAVSLVESALVTVPTVIGWLKPVILIPSSALLGLSQRQLELVIAHELAHIRRYDYVVNYLLLAIETLFFFHPLAYLLGRAIRNERELCCDDLVVQRCGGRLDYVTALTDLETLRSSHALTEPLTNLSATGGDLLHRVRHIVKGNAPQSNVVHVVTISAAATVLLGCAMLAGQRAVPRPTPIAKTVGVTIGVGVTAPVSASHKQPKMRAQAVSPSAAAAFSIERARAASIAAAPPPRPAPRLAPGALGLPFDTHNPLALPMDMPRPALDVQTLADAPRQLASRRDRQGVGPTDVMISELDLAPPVLETLSDLQRDASRALAVAQSPYVVVAPAVDSDFVVQEVDRGQVQGGALIKRIEPRYPSRARMRGYTDTVQVEFLVTDTGEVGDIEVLSSNSLAAFERAVIRAVKKWRYEPLLRDGIPVERRLVETFAFRLIGPPNIDRGVSCSRGKNNDLACTPRGLSRIL